MRQFSLRLSESSSVEKYLCLSIPIIIPIGFPKIGNPIALNALYTRGTISREAIHAWKTMLVSLNHAFDQTSLSHLLFLHHMQKHPLLFSSDGIVPFAPLITAGLASYHLATQDTSSARYAVQLTAKGMHLIEAWCSGDREAVKQALHTFVSRSF